MKCVFCTSGVAETEGVWRVRWEQRSWSTSKNNPQLLDLIRQPWCQLVKRDNTEQNCRDKQNLPHCLWMKSVCLLLQWGYIQLVLFSPWKVNGLSDVHHDVFCSVSEPWTAPHLKSYIQNKQRRLKYSTCTCHAHKNGTCKLLIDKQNVHLLNRGTVFMQQNIIHLL